MKRHTGVMIAVALAAFLVTGFAGSAHALGGYLTWQDANDVDSAFGFGLKHKFQIVPIFSVEARASWLSYGDESFGVSGESGSLNGFPLEAVARAKLGILYGGLGLGYVFFSGPDPKPDGDITSLVLLGGEFSLLGLGAFAEASHRFLEPEVDGNAIDMSGFGLSAGVLFRY